MTSAFFLYDYHRSIHLYKPKKEVDEIFRCFYHLYLFCSIDFKEDLRKVKHVNVSPKNQENHIEEHDHIKPKFVSENQAQVQFRSAHFSWFVIDILKTQTVMHFGSP